MKKQQSNVVLRLCTWTNTTQNMLTDNCTRKWALGKFHFICSLFLKQQNSASIITFPFTTHVEWKFNEIPSRKSFNPSHHTFRIEWVINWFHQQCWDKSDQKTGRESRIDWCLFLFRLGEKRSTHERDKSVYSLPTMKFLAKKDGGESVVTWVTSQICKTLWKINLKFDGKVEKFAWLRAEVFKEKLCEIFDQNFKILKTN